MILILAMAAGLRFYHLGTASLWHDEAAATWFASLSLNELFASLRFEQNPPLFYLLAKIWLSWGRSEVWLRLLPLIFGVASVAVGYRTAREIWSSRTAGLLAAMIIALSTDQVLYSQTFRGYSLLYLLTLGTVFFGWRWGLGGRKGDLAAATGLAVLAFYTHYIFLFYLPALGVMVLGLVWPEKGTRPRRLKALVWAGAVFLLLTSPDLYLFSLNAGQVVKAFWIPALTWPLLGQYLAGMVMSHNLGLIFHLAALILALGWWERRTGLLLSLVYLPLLLIALASVTIKPVMIPRVLLPASAGLALLGARLGQLALEGATARWGRLTEPRQRARLIVAVCLLGAGGFLLLHGVHEKENWRLATSTVVWGYREGDLVAFCPGNIEWSFNWYQPQYTDQELRKIAFPRRLGPGRGLIRDPGRMEEDLKRFLGEMGGAKRLWLIRRQGYWLDRLNAAGVERDLEARGKLKLRLQLGDIELRCYALKGS